MTTIAVIPARYASSRFPGKPLAEIAGRPMILHVVARARQATLVDEVVVATDDERIAQVCRDAGAEVEMTAPDHETGTDRLAEVASRRAADFYVNVQGDEPIIPPDSIDRVVRLLHESATRGIEVSTGYLEGATEAQEADRSFVHLTPTLDNCVMNFSRLPIPCAFREPFVRNIHVGLFAFTRGALERFAARERGPVERAESIELLRFIEYGERIACTPLPPDSISVDHPEDIAVVERAIREAAAKSAS